MPNRPIHVLYIDDDSALARLVEKSLARRGYLVEIFGDAEAGLERIRQGGIDVVGLDHYLANGTGLDVLAALQEIPSPPSVVYVTGSAETAVAVAALKAGAFDYVSKSLAEDFFELLGSAVDQAAERTRLLRAKERAEIELREAKERAELLLSEVNHRVSNSLSMVAALVRLQANAVKESAAKDALAETQARISAIAGLHRRLYTSDDVRTVDMKEYLENLVEEIDHSIGGEGSRADLVLNLEQVKLPTDTAVSIGVIVAELFTNALKYAYPSGEHGEVRIMLNADDKKATLVIEDDGVGWDGTGAAKGSGLGSRLITSMASSIGAEFAYDAEAKGTRGVLKVAC